MTGHLPRLFCRRLHSLQQRAVFLGPLSLHARHLSLYVEWKHVEQMWMGVGDDTTSNPQR